MNHLSRRLATAVHRASLLLSSVVILTAAALPAHGGIKSAFGNIHVTHYTGPALDAEIRAPFDEVILEGPPALDPPLPVAPAGSVIHRDAGTEEIGDDWDIFPNTFSLDSQADLKNDANLVIGSTSAMGDFVFHFEPGDLNHFVGWPDRIRLTQFNPQLQVMSRSILRVDFQVSFLLDEDGIPDGGLPLKVNFKASGSADFARFDYKVKWEDFLGNVDPVTLMGDMEFMGGEIDHLEENPDPFFDDPVKFAPDGGLENSRFIVSGFLQMQVKNDTAPAVFEVQNVTSIPEPSSLALGLLAVAAVASRVRRKR